MTFKRLLFRVISPLVMTLLLLSGCGSDEHNKKAKTQVVAKVNGDEISIHQVNQQLGSLGALDEEKKKAATKQILNRLIDMQLLEQKAIEFELDRNPQVLQAIEASRKQILAQAYIQKEMLKTSKPTQIQIDTFYDEHPELFAERKVFNLQEIAIDGASDNVASIDQAVEEKTNISEVAEWLKASGYQFSLNANVRAAEQLPSKLLDELKVLEDGQMLTVVNGKSVNVISIAASQVMPVSKDKAIPVIEKYFQNKNKKEELKKQMSAIKQAANIEYVGAFADMQNETVEQEQQEIDATNTTPVEVDSNADASNLDKALEGF